MKTDSPLPIIDFAAWDSKTNSSDRAKIARDLVEACHRTGFVYITNHGVPPAEVEAAFAWSKKFFDLPLEDKMKAKRNDDSIAFRGYNWPGHQQIPLSAGVRDKNPDLVGKSPDYNETYEMGSDENQDELNIWIPDHVLPGFRSFSTDFYWQCSKVAQKLLQALALGLGLHEDFLLQYHSGHQNELSMRHYPPIRHSQHESHEKAQLGAHSDIDSITLLFQDDCSGLEVENCEKSGDFFPAPPVENALVMNIGDVMMRWSNDYLRSTIHRVQPPPLQKRDNFEDAMTRERFSIPYFISPKLDTVLECLPCCVDEMKGPKYPPETFLEVSKRFSEGVYD